MMLVEPLGSAWVAENISDWIIAIAYFRSAEQMERRAREGRARMCMLTCLA